MGTILILGFLIGMRHAMEADHVAAVASLATRSRSIGESVRQGVAWGLGHTITLFFFGAIVIGFQLVVPERLAEALEFAVGVMLLLLGLDVLRRLRKNRIHFHVHDHEDGVRHLHAHAHSPDGLDVVRHAEADHEHEHLGFSWKDFPLRALFVGLMHGMAGSAALILLTLETVRSPWLGMLYVALFGLGSICGMALLSAVIAVPLSRSAGGLTRFHVALDLLVGLGTTALGLVLILTHLPGA